MKKASFYNLYFDDSNHKYVFNTLTSSLIGVPSSIVDALRKNEFSGISKDSLKFLCERGIVVDSLMNESRYFEYYYNTRQYRQSDELFVVVIPTYNCNLRCTYCYQGGNRKSRSMGANEYKAILNFIKIQIYQKKLKSIKLIFFGGEPLLCKDYIIQLAEEIRRIANETKLNFYSSIITNAVLVNQEIIDKLLIPNSMTIQVSIDGNRISHDKKRIDALGRGTYDNIKLALRKMVSCGLKKNIILRINIDKTNCAEIESILEEFSSLVGKFYFGRLRPDGNYGCNSELCITTEEYQTIYLPLIRSLATKYPIDRCERQFGKKHPCGFNKTYSYIIDPYLDVYKCDGLVGNSLFSVGKILDDGQFKKNDNFFLQATWSPFRYIKCKKCKLLPLCAGGCPYSGYIKTRNIESPYCEYTEELVVRELIAVIRSKNKGEGR